MKEGYTGVIFSCNMGDCFLSNDCTCMFLDVVVMRILSFVYMSSLTSPSSGQAGIFSQLRHLQFFACHSRAALEDPEILKALSVHYNISETTKASHECRSSV